MSAHPANLHRIRQHEVPGLTEFWPQEDWWPETYETRALRDAEARTPPMNITDDKINAAVAGLHNLHRRVDAAIKAGATIAEAYTSAGAV